MTVRNVAPCVSCGRDDVGVTPDAGWGWVYKTHRDPLGGWCTRGGLMVSPRDGSTVRQVSVTD